MANIECTVEEFIDLFGEKVTNSASNLAKPIKKVFSRCESCFKKTDKLQSAHIVHKDKMIEEILYNYKGKKGNVEGDIGAILREIEESHKPILDSFVFLCGKCHKKYDGNNNVETEDSPMVDIEWTKQAREYKKLYKIKEWSKQRDYNNSKIITAYLMLSSNGIRDVTIIQLKEYCSDKDNRPEVFVGKFESAFASMKIDSGNSYGKVFYELENGIVKVYSVVLDEILKYFK